ncbi:histone deacetylase 6-like [Patiria miniata]|uniref:Protein deacetylase HDAC6 n=1 Tax=Patiria miniata TaxID=46514 RepID=A0A913ZU23_PATMI|nr:histone deacetylase 6-like [Patiria miniata]XP_038054577.1 histone deacetylase 6-like [Patiria miniata]XP_038054578.1 histone deacetylase 6-like [Patiria miniata]
MEDQPTDPLDHRGSGKDTLQQQPSDQAVQAAATPDDQHGNQGRVPQDASQGQPPKGKHESKQHGPGKKGGKKTNGRTNSALEAVKKKGRENVQQSQTGEDDLAVQMAGMTISETLQAVPSGTGLVYDECLTQHTCPFNSRHFIAEHYDRILMCHKRLQDYKLLERCTHVTVRLALDDEILSVHSADYLESFKTTQTMGDNELKSWAEQYDSVFVNNNTYECASLVLGGLLDLTEKVVKGELRNGIAIVRPPGHHAQRTIACGYSLFNNVALAAHMARHKWNCERVLIVDWDVHHGQGVQYIFEEDPSVLYFSIHRFEHLDFWPHLTDSDSNVFGKGRGLGFNVNVPWNKVGMGDSEYLAVFQQVLLPMAYEFNPDLVLVCCGFDSAIGDPKGEMAITPVGYTHLTHALMGLADGKVVLALEGGYNLKVMAECAAMCTQTLLGDPCPLLPPTTEPDESAVETILDVIKNIRPHWQCYEYQVAPEYVQSDLVSSTSSGKMPSQAIKTDQSPQRGTEQGAGPLDSTVQSAEGLETVDSNTQSEGAATKGVEPVVSTVQSEGTTDKGVEPVVGLTCQSEGTTEKGAEPVQSTIQSVERPTSKEVEPEEIDSLVNRLISEVVLTVPKHRTCLVYDAEMMQHRTAFNHPERPERISRIFSKHEKMGLVQRCLRVESRRATTEELHWCHSAEYIERLQAMQENTSRELYKMQDDFNSIYLHQSSFDCASLAVGSTLNVVDMILSNQARNGVAIVRPPGHHAEAHTAMGFCFFNTVALAARYAQRKFGLKRVLILDWDIHHGNGTQHAFESDPSVLYISLHRYENGMFFPSSPDGAPDVTGQGEGEGYNVNIAWNVDSMGDAEYIAAFTQIVMPIAYEYSPELVLVSAGFDAACGDPLGGYKVTPAGYAHMTHMLSSLANGRVVVSLEGGYNLNSISESMAMCTRTLLGDPCPSIHPGSPCPSAIQAILETLYEHQEYWKSLKYQVNLPTNSSVEDVKAKATSTQNKDAVCSQPRTSSSGGDMDKHGADDTASSSRPYLHDPDGAGECAPKSEATPADAAAAPVTGGNGDNKPSMEELGAAGGVDPANKSTVTSSAGEGKTIADVFGQQPELFAVVPLPWCPHLEGHVSPIPVSSPIDTRDPCSECGDTSENWVCLQCYQVLCGRYVNEHMLFHSISTSHLVVLSYADLSVWCYGCDSYVHHQIVFPAKRAGHISKFGCDDPGI